MIRRLIDWCVPRRALHWGWPRAWVDAAFACQQWVDDQRHHNRTWVLEARFPPNR